MNSVTLDAIREVLDLIDGDPREFVAAYEHAVTASGNPLALHAAVIRWHNGTL